MKLQLTWICRLAAEMSFTPSLIPTLVAASPLRKFSNPNGAVRSRSVKQAQRAFNRSFSLSDFGKMHSTIADDADKSSQKYGHRLGLDRCMIE
jgi:hypothetical protein